jgi:hypothetical protein
VRAQLPLSAQLHLPARTRLRYTVLTRRARGAQTESLLTAVDILRKTKFHAFPVVRPTSEGDVFVGMITREHLTVRAAASWCPQRPC